MGDLKVNVSLRRSWWLVPSLWVIARLVLLMVITPNKAEGWVNRLIGYGVKYRVGNGPWMRSTFQDFEMIGEGRGGKIL